MLVFPKNPEEGDVFAPHGHPTWVWDGMKWTTASLAGIDWNPPPEPPEPEPLDIVRTLAPAVVDTPYTAQLEATGGHPPYAWEKIAGSATWASVDLSGAVTGTPPAVGTQDLEVQVTDDESETMTAVVELEIAAE